MGLVAFKERRLNPRKQLSGLLPGRIRFKGGAADLSCRPVDVSRNGLGILVPEELKEGTLLVMIMGDQEIELKIAWGQPDFGKQDIFRYGLTTTDPDLALDQIFEKAGCFA